MNSKSPLLASIREHYPGYHPLLSIAHLAHNPETDYRLQFDCHKTIAKYIEPELKSLEVKGHIQETRRVTVSLFGEEEAEILDPDFPIGYVVDVC